MEPSVYRLGLLFVLCALGCAKISTTPESFTVPVLKETSATSDYSAYGYDGTTSRPDSESSSTVESTTEQIQFSSTKSPLTSTTTSVSTDTTSLVSTSTQSPLTTNTTAPPTTTVPLTTNTTALPTNITSPLPTNSSTTLVTVSTPAPTTTLPPLPNPSVGNYVVRSDPNASACLMANMGLQFHFSVGASTQTINLDPNVTSSSGTCGKNGSDSTLVLTSDKITVRFVFSNQMDKFHLSVLNFTVDNGNGSLFSAVNTNLSLWEASLGSSYMCQKEQSFNITDSLLLNTFRLQVQPFNVTNNKFSSAHECSLDDSSLLIPIIVGAALAGLILVVLIAYVIGRRKTYVGYQTL